MVKVADIVGLRVCDMICGALIVKVACRIRMRLDNRVCAIGYGA